MKLLPLVGNAGAAIGMIVALADACNEEGPGRLEAWRLQVGGGGRVHHDRLLKCELVEARCGAHLLRRDAEMVAERAGECFVGAIIRVQRQGEDIGCTLGQRARRLGEATSAHIAHHGHAGRFRKRPHHVEARDTSDGCDLVKRQAISQMALDVPQRFLGRVHGLWLSFEAPPGCGFWLCRV